RQDALRVVSPPTPGFPLSSGSYLDGMFSGGGCPGIHNHPQHRGKAKGKVDAWKSQSGIAERSTATSREFDIVCSPCQPGFYSSGSGSECRPCRQCPPGKHERRKCKPHHNTRCSSCGKGKFSSDGKKCHRCSVCPAGTEQRRACTKTKDTRCEDCPSGYFSPGGGVPCKPCSTCNGSQELLVECTSSTDTACYPCFDGFFFDNSTSECRKCSQCPDGTVTKQQCSRTSDTVCSPCPPRTFSSRAGNVCLNCSSCPRGSIVRLACSLSEDTRCQKCQRGSFASQNQKSCVRCSYCPAGSETKRRCTTKRDTTCSKCSSGFHSPGYGFSCRVCSLCPPGMYVKRACKRSRDTVCQPCSEGTYTDTWSSRPSCPRCGTCSYPQATLRPCTIHSDVECGSCIKGYFVDRVTGRCQKCSYCYPDKPGLTVQEYGCRSEPEDWQCRPLTYTNLSAVLLTHPPTPPPREDPTTSTDTAVLHGSRQNLDAGEDSEPSESAQFAVLIVPALIGVTLLSVLLGFFVHWQLQRKRRHNGDIAGKLPSGTHDSSAVTVVTWMNRLEMTPHCTSEARHSWPKKTATDAGDGLDSLETTASSGVLQNPGCVRKLEQRVSDSGRGLYAKRSLEGSVNEAGPDSLPHNEFV
ncbi:hypothetical protein BaRGS_00021766, partial [Batillaria attramentaria]